MAGKCYYCNSQLPYIAPTKLKNWLRLKGWKRNVESFYANRPGVFLMEHPHFGGVMIATRRWSDWKLRLHQATIQIAKTYNLTPNQLATKILGSK